MRLFSLFLVAAVLGNAAAQTTPVCTNLCLQQVAAGTCATGQTTSVSGVIYAPNGTDPLPNVTVYIPNDVVQPLAAGVQCPIVGTPPSGSPLVGVTTGVDGSFTITNVPVGTNIPLVFISGKWRRQIVIPTTTACTNVVLPPDQTRFPRNQTEGDIPLFAVATGAVDGVECVLRKVGVQDAEFTDPAGGGRIQIYTGSGSPGAHVDAATPSQTQLMSNLTTLQNYDVLMLPCQGGQYAQTATEESNFDTFVNNGGRVYASHYSYVWMYYPGYTNGPFAGVANWQVNDGSYNDGLATINQNFSGGLTLAEWMQQPAIAASTTQGQIEISTLKHDLVAPNGVIAPTQSWFTLNTTNNPVMQFVFDAPVGATNQCGRVLYNEYHVEAGSSQVAFPAECVSGAAMTPQEKLLEFMLFELTDQGGAATLTPTTQDFGSQAIGFNSAPQTFTVTNASTFAINSPQITITAGFTVSSTNCATIAAGGTCSIIVVFNPTTTGPNTGTLSVSAGATNLLANLTGTGVPDLSFSIPSLSYGSLDVGATAAQTFSVTNTASGPVIVSGVTIASTPSGAFTYTTTCPTGSNKLAAGASCTDTVIFEPTTTGPITGTLSVAGTGVTPSVLTGNGIDFTFAATPASGTVIAGDNITFTTTTSPIAGFANPVTVTCLTTVPGSTCKVSNGSFTPSSPATSTITITTTSQYSVIGYSAGLGGQGLLWLIGLGSGCFLLLTRRRAGSVLRLSLMLAMLAAATLGASGCSGKLPSLNAVNPASGTYNAAGGGTGGGSNGGGYTVTATDGFLVHTANFALTVTAK